MEQAGSKAVELQDGTRLSGKRYIAQAVWELATTGHVTLPSGAVWVVDPKDWLETVKWLYAQIDPPKLRTEHTGENGAAIVIRTIGGVDLEHDL